MHAEEKAMETQTPLGNLAATRSWKTKRGFFPQSVQMEYNPTNVQISAQRNSYCTRHLKNCDRPDF